MTICTTPKILIVEDDLDGRALMGWLLEEAGYKILEMGDGLDALGHILKRCVDIVISDLRLPGMDGVELLKRTKAAAPDIEVILVTGYGSVDLAVEAVKAGAYDFITKPVEKAYLFRVVQKAAEKQYLARQYHAFRSQPNGSQPRVIYADATSEMRKVMQIVEQVAPSTATVLITGETGTGKEVIADAIHATSPRRDRRLVKVSCAALPDTLLEDELFGHERGAYTGAEAGKIGRFELADGGSLFLDEIAEITPAIQVKLLRVLEDGKFERLGGTRTVNTDVRIIAATNKDLEHEITEHRFREDLFYRLNVIDLHLPPLRQRKNDIPLLAFHFLKVYAERNRKDIEGFSDDAMNALISYDWPGNVRELENAVERAVVLTTTKNIPLSVLPSHLLSLAEVSRSVTFKIGMSWRELQRQAIDITLAHTRGNKRMAARLLGVAIRTLYRHLNANEHREHSAENPGRHEISATAPAVRRKSFEHERC